MALINFSGSLNNRVPELKFFGHQADLLAEALRRNSQASLCKIATVKEAEFLHSFSVDWGSKNPKTDEQGGNSGGSYFFKNCNHLK